MQSPFLLAIQEFMIVKRYAKRTIQTYLYWIADYIRHQNYQHPKKMGDYEVQQYLTYLSIKHIELSEINQSSSNFNYANKF